MIADSSEYNARELPVYFSPNLKEYNKINAVMVSSVKDKNFYFKRKNAFAILGFGRMDNDAGYTQSVYESVRYNFGLVDKFFEIYFNADHGYMLFGRETIHQDLDFVKRKMIDNFHYVFPMNSLRVQTAKQSDQAELYMSEKESRFVLNPSAKRVKISSAFFEKILNIVCEKLKIFEDAKVKNKVQKALCRDDSLSLKIDLSEDEAESVNKFLNFSLVSNFEERRDEFKLAYLFFRCDHLKNSEYCFAFDKSSNGVNELGNVFLQDRIVRIDNSEGHISISKQADDSFYLVNQRLKVTNFPLTNFPITIFSLINFP